MNRYHLYAIFFILLIVVGQADASALATECDDGYVYKLFSTGIVQAKDESGMPQLCGDRLNAAQLRLGKYKAVMDEYQTRIQAELSRQLYFPSYTPGEKQ